MLLTINKMLKLFCEADCPVSPFAEDLQRNCTHTKKHMVFKTSLYLLKNTFNNNG